MLDRLRSFGSFVWRTLQRWDESGGMRHGAAVAFYTILSLAPLLLLAVSAVSLLPRDAESERVILDQVSRIAGARGAEVAERVLENAPDREQGLWGVAGSFALLLFSGSVLFVNIQSTLNQLWNVRPPDKGIVRGFIRNRLRAILTMFVAAGVFLISMILGAAAAWVAPLVEARLPVGSTLVQLLEVGVTGVVLMLLCATIYRILPDVEIAWRDVWFGAALTTVLFLLGRAVIGWYLSTAAAVSRFGAAGSLFAFLLWVYYSSHVFFIGAEFTQVQAEERGAPLTPSKGAARIERTVHEAGADA